MFEIIQYYRIASPSQRPGKTPMKNLLLMIELTVSFYATQVIWQVGTHPSAYRQAGQLPKDQRAHRSDQVSARLRQPLLDVPVRASRSLVSSNARRLLVKKAAYGRRRRGARSSRPDRRRWR
jgi:hypothetical protein